MVSRPNGAAGDEPAGGPQRGSKIGGKTDNRRRPREAGLIMTPVPLGERRSSGMSGLHPTYPGDTYLLINVTVTQVKEGCALGLVLEHLDEDGALAAAENVATYTSSRTHQRITTVKGCRLRIKWIMTGLKPLSTFAVIAQGISSMPASIEDGSDEDPDLSETLPVDLTTFQGLHDYLGIMTREAQAGS